MGYGRPLDSNVLVEHFLSNCLGIGNNLELDDGNRVPLGTLAKRVRDAELLIGGTGGTSTLHNHSNRDHSCRSDLQRSLLREKIVEELLTFERLDSDDAISLGAGGAKPIGNAVVKKNKQAFLITGLPASGKSSIVSKVADHFGAYVIDPDFAKRKLPEFDGTMVGANLVHEESSAITFSARGYTDPSFLLSCFHFGLNIVRPMIGGSHEKLVAFRDVLKDQGYEVHLTSIVLDRKLAAKRALNRFVLTERYVSLGYIFDECANDPVLTYYKNRLDAQIAGASSWASFGAICTSTDVPMKIDEWGSNNPVSLF